MLESVPREVLLAAGAAAFAWALLLSLRWRLQRFRTRRRFARGLAGEREAVGLLERAGFSIEAAQIEGAYDVAVDGAAVTILVRADYLVSRAGRRWIAEVKTGRAAPHLATPSTRRQLLEYQLAFDTAGIVLVDADAKTIRTVVFDLAPTGRGPAILPWALAAFAAVAVALALGIHSG